MVAQGVTYLMISRRLFLSMAVAAQLKMIVRSTRPEDLEMPPDGFTDFITPIDNFFVRSHVSVPKVDLAQWQLKVDGHVSNSLSLTMADLQKMPSVEVVSVLECAGNGRSFYVPPVAGLQWANGAVGNGRWRGVRLADVLRRAGVNAGAVEILFDGADVPLGTMEDFQRSIPLKKALDASTILAYEMNGETLPVKHGFPLRAVIPGWAGDSWSKWITGIRVLNEEAKGFWMKNAYLHPGKPVTPGTVVAADAMKPVTSLRVKSVIASPANESSVEPGKPVLVRGAAWTGDAGGRISGVDVSVDQGRTWKPANLNGPATAFGWRLWEFSWVPLRDQRYTILARARDTSGDMQPVLQEWNPSGYLFNVIARVDVNAGNSASQAAIDSGNASTVPPVAGFKERCLVCHDDDVIRQQRLTRAQWDREINKMTGWGARVTSEDRQALLDYLVRIAGPR
jgi:DMSO/TMAO reductase YedYZ molybdopterin-dependent catalytic subunit